MAACLAMLTERTLDYVLYKVKTVPNRTKDKYYVPTREAILYLLEHDLWFGGEIAIPKQPTTFPFTLSVELGKHKALVTVKSQVYDDALHAVVYDPITKKFYDPQKDEPQDPSQYEIVAWGTVINNFFND